MITTVLFDLDGTLLPMDQDVFLSTYFKGLATKLAPYGYEPKKLMDVVLSGTAAMIANNGEKTNEVVFWDLFTSRFGENSRNDGPTFEEFYQNEFQDVRNVCGFDPRAAETVKKIKESGLRVALATNPLFPAIATESRIRWAGLSPDDFELYTTYENVRYSKPNLGYYLEITEKLGVSPEECLMVGNDVRDDMVVVDIGMKVFLLTDNLINKKSVDISIYPHGSFDELSSYIDTLIG